MLFTKATHVDCAVWYVLSTFSTYGDTGNKVPSVELAADFIASRGTSPTAAVVSNEISAILLCADKADHVSEATLNTLSDVRHN